MTVREGSLEAPTRHALDWKSAEFYDESKLGKEFERIFGICHGCRRCVNLCTAFPTLFDLIDEGATGEVDGVEKSRYWEVVDRCYLCDMCYMTKCPYVPPHPWNVDFPHTMLRGKAVKFRKGEVKLRDRLLSSTDAVGKLVTIPVVVQFVNAANRNGVARDLMQRTLGVHKDRMLPEYASHKFRRAARPDATFPVKDGAKTPGKVALFATCYITYNEPGIGHDLLAILAHNEIPVTLVEKEVCCGMPKLELGDLDAVSRLKDVNIPVLARFARAGYAILTAVPSCTLMFKQELPLMFPDDADVKAVAEAMYDPFEYLVLRNKDGLLRTDFTQPLGKVSYHVPCHLRVQNLGQKTRELLEKIPGTVVTTVERCSGHDGTWGVKSEYFEQSMKIGRPVFRQMAEAAPDYISSDCAIAARHIEQGMGETAAAKQHPLTLVRIAYGL
jgi:Fe-S oxidoreductase